MQRGPKILLLLYLLVGYVIAQFSWWAYSIYDLNVDLLEKERELLLAQGTEVGPIQDTVKGKVLMIFGEGAVFLGLLLVGAYYIRRFILREHRLARQERNFLLATTHEFNSPIASVKLNLQTLAKREVSLENKEKLIDGALSSTQRLELLVTNILMASRLDAGKLELLEENLELHEFFRHMESRYHSLAERADCSVQLEVDDSVTLHVDRNALETIIGNLIENAIKYAPSSDITIGYKVIQKGIRMFVRDNGPGIPEQEREAVFRKFYRPQNEETRSQKGSGLGLYLVKELIELHKGTVSIEPVTPSGVQINVHFKATT